MGITITKKPELDANGERWVSFRKTPLGGIEQCSKEEADASILVGSTAAPLYKSHYGLIVRHLGAIDAQTRVGTNDFGSDSLPSVVFEQESDLLIDLVAKHLIKDWEGIDETDNPGVPAPYSKELCKSLMYQMPGVYFIAIQVGRDIALRAEEKSEETAGKPSPRTAGAASGRARQTKKSAGSMSA